MPWFTLDNFSQGIADRPSSLHPPGTAEGADTYGCYADPDGSIIPLPAVDTNVSLGTTHYDTLKAGGLQAGATNEVRICGISWNDPLFSDDTDPGTDESNSEIYVAFEAWRAATTVRNIGSTAGTAGANLYVDKDSESLGRLWCAMAGAADDYFDDDGNTNLAWTVKYDADPAANQGATRVYHKASPDRLVADLTTINASADLYVRSCKYANRTTVKNLPLDNTLTNEWIKITHDASASSGNAVNFDDSANLINIDGAEPDITNATVDELALSVWRYHWHETTPSWDLCWAAQRAVKTFDADVRPKRCSFARGYSNSAADTTAGPVITGWTFDGYAIIWPDDTAPAANLGALVAGSLGDQTNNDAGLVLPTDCVGHQGRMVIFPLTLSSVGTTNGSNAVVRTNNEGFYWTKVNNWITRDPSLSTFFTVAGYEYPTGYSLMEGLTADELLLLKGRGGALVLRGSLNDYTSITKPLVRSPGKPLNRGTKSPLGFVYPCDASGIWLWPGGDTSVNLTPQMTDEFWRPATNSPANGTQAANGWGFNQTGCADYGDFVALPNNYLMDMSKGLEGVRVWRTEHPSTSGVVVSHYVDSDWKQRWLAVAPSGVGSVATDGDTDTVLRIYDKSTLSETYTLRTHPLPIGEMTGTPGGVNKVVDISSVVVEATGAGTVTVTIASGRSGESQSYAFNLSTQLDNADVPQTRRKQGKVKGSHIYVKIDADNSSNSAQAAKVDKVHIQYETDEQISSV